MITGGNPFRESPGSASDGCHKPSRSPATSSGSSARWPAEFWDITHFQWIYDHGFYGMMIPGALLGLGCGLLAQHASQIRGVLCALAGLGLGLFTEWRFRPFMADEQPSLLPEEITSARTCDLADDCRRSFFCILARKGRRASACFPAAREPASRERAAAFCALEADDFESPKKEPCNVHSHPRSGRATSLTMRP